MAQEISVDNMPIVTQGFTEPSPKIHIEPGHSGLCNGGQKLSMGAKGADAHLDNEKIDYGGDGLDLEANALQVSKGRAGKGKRNMGLHQGDNELAKMVRRRIGKQVS